MQVKHNRTIFLRVVGYFYTEAFRFRPSYLILIAFNIIAKSISPYVNIIFPALLINELTKDKNIGRIILYIAIIIGGNYFFSTLIETLKNIIESMEDALERHFDLLLSRRTLELDYEQTEDSKVIERLVKAEQGMSGYTNGIGNLSCYLTAIFSATITIIGIIAIILRYSVVIIAFLVITILLSIFINQKINKIELVYFHKTAQEKRRLEYVSEELMSYEYGKDIRLYDSSEMIEFKGNQILDALADKLNSACVKKNHYAQTDNFVVCIRQVFIYTFLGYYGLIGKISLGVFTILINSAYSFVNSISSMLENIQSMVRCCNCMNEFINYMEIGHVLINDVHNKAPLFWGDQLTFEFRNVSFRYPKSENYVIRNLNLTVNYGEKLSIVGINGAGKTTFVKLLCRLYDVTEGAIFLNGKNIKEYDYDEYLSLFSVVFQDFKLLAFSIRENILIDDEMDEEKLLHICNIAGIKEKIDKLEKGTMTSVYKLFEKNGIEFSGGEAQKIAIARALAKDAPIIILDEPTAALDPIAEAKVYESYHQLIGKKTGVYISHRLSSCRFSDHIAVFEGSTIKEYGTHDELIKKEHGIYAYMYHTQAKYYAQDKTG